MLIMGRSQAACVLVALLALAVVAPSAAAGKTWTFEAPFGYTNQGGGINTSASPDGTLRASATVIHPSAGTSTFAEAGGQLSSPISKDSAVSIEGTLEIWAIALVGINSHAYVGVRDATSRTKRGSGGSMLDAPCAQEITAADVGKLITISCTWMGVRRDDAVSGFAFVTAHGPGTANLEVKLHRIRVSG